MSASARFLLEFQATGDQEVVNKIREVGGAGKEATTDLESLQGIEDPFAAVGQGAEGAIGPITEVGSATEELGGDIWNRKFSLRRLWRRANWNEHRSRRDGRWSDRR